MKTLKVLLTYFLLAALFACQSVPSSSSENASEGPASEETDTEGTTVRDDDIYIFFTSDVHCGVEDNLGYPALKALIDEVKQEHEYVRLVDCGDHLQGGTLGTLSKGKLIIDIMNAMDYDLATVGNHEFDYGMEELAKRMQEARFTTIASNVSYSGSKENIFADAPAYVIEDFGGTKVAFLGVLTPSSLTDSTPKFFMEGDEFVYDFYSGNNGQDLYDRIQQLVEEVRQQGADYVIVLSHLGSNTAAAPFDSISLISHTSGIDVVLDGHSHSQILGDPYPNKDGEDVLLSSVGTKLQAAGELIITVDGNIEILQINESEKKDETVQKVIDDANAQLEAILNEKICDLDYELTIADAEGIRMVRTRETTAGDFVADAYRYALSCEIALVNGGGVRSAIPAGEITVGSILNVNPFQNTLSVVRASGQEILDALEYGAAITEKLYAFDGNAVGENGAFLQVSGLKYTIDTSVTSAVEKDENGIFSGYSGEERRVKDVYVLQEGEYVPLDPEKTYTVGGTSYLLLDLGDGNAAFRNSEVVLKDGMMDVEALQAYLEAHDGFGDDYRETQGLITVE